jgi:TetR/AcrR family fatty acid metabolism transcriptional regulator
MRSEAPVERSFVETARRTQIVAGAIEVLADQGYAAASLATIAAHVGVSKGVISYHFAGKEELLREVVSSVLAGAGEYMTPRVKGAKSALQALETYIVVNLEYLDEHRREMDALTEILSHQRVPGETRSLAGDATEAAVRALAELIRAGQRAGEFRRCDAQAVAHAIRASIASLPVLLRTAPDLDLSAHARELTQLFSRAVAA